MVHGWIWFASVVTFAFAMSGTPGPNNTMLFRSGVRFGMRPTIPHMIGVSVGFPVLFLAVAFGAAAVLRSYPIVFSVMRSVGIVYLVWLAWHIASEPAAPLETVSTDVNTRTPMTFLQAALFQWINPKAWIIASGTMLTYTHPGAGQIYEILTITSVFLFVNPCTCLAWSWFGVVSARMIKGTKAAAGLQYGMAALLVLSIIPLIVEQLEALHS